MLYLRDAESLREKGILEPPFVYGNVLASYIADVNKANARAMDKIREQIFDKEMQAILEKLFKLEKDLQHTRELKEACAAHKEILLNTVDDLLKHRATILSQNFNNVREFTALLLQLERIGDTVLAIQEHVRKQTDECISGFARVKRQRGVLELYNCLKEMRDPIANLIITKYKQFDNMVERDKMQAAQQRNNIDVML